MDHAIYWSKHVLRAERAHLRYRLLLPRQLGRVDLRRDRERRQFAVGEQGRRLSGEVVRAHGALQRGPFGNPDC